VSVPLEQASGDGDGQGDAGMGTGLQLPSMNPWCILTSASTGALNAVNHSSSDGGARTREGAGAGDGVIPDSVTGGQGSNSSTEAAPTATDEDEDGDGDGDGQRRACIGPLWVSPGTATSLARGESERTFANLSGVDTRDDYFSWGVELRDLSVELTGYALRDGNGLGASVGYMRNWALDGSRNGESWTVLALHERDDAVRYNGAVTAWRLARKSLPCSFFRVRLLGPNSVGDHRMALAGIELYGRVMDRRDECAAPRNSCGAHGECRGAGASLRCACDIGWWGPRCDEKQLPGALSIETVQALGWASA